MHRNLCLLLIAALSTGCAELSILAVGGNNLIKASERNPVTEVMCLWEPAEGQGLDGLPSRGFAGQILFFTPGHVQPAKVDGEVTIYIFDDFGTVEEQARPLHQFNFDADSWDAFLRKANIGASYQVFIPYTRAGSFEATCSIRVKYTARDGGRPVYSTMATIKMPGRERPASEKVQQPEGNSVPSPAGAPARTESVPTLTLPSPAAAALRGRLKELEAAAAAATRNLDAAEPARLPGEAVEAQPIEDAAPVDGAKAYRLWSK